MCGIVGIVSLTAHRKVPESRIVEAMRDVMVHRGPDGAGLWKNRKGTAFFGHRRLSIVDLSERGHQPMTTPEGDLAVTFNGEIYNHLDLRKRLERLGHVFKSDSDTESILHCYREYGDEFHHYLDGDFAIALWDDRKQKLFLARDQAGVKPLYYAMHDGYLIFASELNAILQYPGFPREMDDVALYHYLTYLVTPPPQTLVRGIKKLAAATILEFQLDGQANISTYWKPEPQSCDRSSAELDEELEDIFNRSVRKRLMSDVPVGLLFSGGVDSTLNLTTFKELVAPNDVHTFTVGMENLGNQVDDADIARRMASELGSVHHETYISEADLLSGAETLAQRQDEPVSDPVVVPLYFVTKMAKEAGFTVLHSGEGADELFCGYDNYLRFLGHRKKLWDPLSRFPRWVARVLALPIRMIDHPQARKVYDVLIRRARGQEFFMSSAVAYYEQEKQPVLSEDFRDHMKSVDSFDVVAPFYEELRQAHPGATFLQAISYIEQQLRLPELLLMRADKMSMANSVEVRVPFLDRDLQNFARKLPDDFKVDHGVGKAPIKRLAAKSIRPEEIYRPKTGFGLPVKSWFEGALGDALRDELSGSTSSLADRLESTHIVGRLDSGLHSVNDGFQMWVLYNLIVWERSVLA